MFKSSNSILNSHDPNQEEVDYLIIGGGINGVAIARELSLRQQQVMLVEQSDIGSGTSSASSKLAHGGLRYLEQLHFKLVRRSCIERDLLIQNSPHLVKPLPFLIPIYSHSTFSRFQIKCGLTLYDLLSGHRRIHPHMMLSAKETLAKEPDLNPKGLLGAGLYFDAQMDDARLCIEIAKQAQQYGAIISNYTKAEILHKQGEKLHSATIVNTLTGKKTLVKAKFFINTTGPWATEVHNKINAKSSPLIQKSKGIHIVVKRMTHHHAILIRSKQDNRVFFVIPWKNHSLIGTTDTPFNDAPDTVRITQNEIDYLIEETNRIFPKVPLKTSDIISTFAGIRPLIKQNKTSMSSISREEKSIKHHNALSVIGGKYTTFRYIAEKVAKDILQDKNFQSLTHDLPSYGGDLISTDELLRQNIAIESKLYGCSKSTLAHVIEHYGSAYPHVLSYIYSTKDGRKQLGNTPHFKGEIRYAIHEEFAKTALDFLRRRTAILLSETNGLSCLEEILNCFSSELNWSKEREENEQESVLNEIQMMIPKSKHSDT